MTDAGQKLSTMTLRDDGVSVSTNSVASGTTVVNLGDNTSP